MAADVSDVAGVVVEMGEGAAASDLKSAAALSARLRVIDAVAVRDSGALLNSSSSLPRLKLALSMAVGVAALLPRRREGATSEAVELSSRTSNKRSERMWMSSQLG